MNTYLHQCLRVIPRPLFEAATMGEAAEAREWWHSSNSALECELDTKARIRDAPAIDIIKNRVSLTLSIRECQVATYPCHKVVLEGPFNDLM
jgi:hypothetical protein